MKYCAILFCCLILFSCGKENPNQTATEKINELKTEYAPDKRVAIWDVQSTKRGDKFVLKGETQFPEAKQKLFAQLDSLNMAYVDSIELLPAAHLNGIHFGFVRLPVANIRSMPKHSAELSTQATLGTPLRVLKKIDSWYLVQTPDRYLGYLDAAGFTPMNVNQYKNWIDQEKFVVTSNHASVYSAADASSSLVSNVLVGNILVNNNSRIGSFVQVFFPDGRNGYINIADISSFDRWLESQPFNDTSIIADAFRFMGTPYLWGGTSPSGFDCSGFTKTVFYLNGMLLPRDASQQVNVGVDLGTAIDMSKWAKGDLLFFGRKADGDQSEKITHVAIYLGDGKIIHSAGNVKVESLNRTDPDFAPERYETFVRARRMLGVAGDNGVYAIENLPEYGG